MFNIIFMCVDLHSIRVYNVNMSTFQWGDGLASVCHLEIPARRKCCKGFTLCQRTTSLLRQVSLLLLLDTPVWVSESKLGSMAWKGVNSWYYRCLQAWLLLSLIFSVQFFVLCIFFYTVLQKWKYIFITNVVKKGLELNYLDTHL